MEETIFERYGSYRIKIADRERPCLYLKGSSETNNHLAVVRALEGGHLLLYRFSLEEMKGDLITPFRPVVSQLKLKDSERKFLELTCEQKGI